MSSDPDHSNAVLIDGGIWRGDLQEEQSELIRVKLVDGSHRSRRRGCVRRRVGCSESCSTPGPQPPRRPLVLKSTTFLPAAQGFCCRRPAILSRRAPLSSLQEVSGSRLVAGGVHASFSELNGPALGDVYCAASPGDRQVSRIML